MIRLLRILGLNLTKACGKVYLIVFKP